MTLMNDVRTFIRELICPDGHGREVSENRRGSAYPPVSLPERLASETQRLLRSFHDSGEGQEGLVYWAGVARGRGGVVTTLVVPDADSGYGYVETTPRENADVIRWLHRWELELLGQAHSHPPGAGSVHSPGDDRMTFSSFEGQVSVVVANHAERCDEYLDDWGVHRFIRGHFEAIAPGLRDEHLRIVPSVYDRRAVSADERDTQP